MEEYIMDVEVDNERTILKTFSRTVEGAVDNVVKMNGVQKLFAIGNKNLYLTNSDGKLIVVDLQNGSIIKTEKVSSNLVSKPFIYNNNLYLIRNGSIVRYN